MQVTQLVVSPVLVPVGREPEHGVVLDPRSNLGTSRGQNRNINHTARAFSQTDRRRDRWERAEYLDTLSRQTDRRMDMTLLLSVCHDRQDGHI